MKQKLTILIILSLLALTGCNLSGSDKSKELELKEKELALKEKELELSKKSSTDGNSDKAGKSSDAEKAGKSESSSNKAETTKKEEKTNPTIVTAEQVNGTWSKGESWIKIKAIGGGKLNVNFSIFNERTTNAGQAEGVANINGIDATFSPKDFEKCKFTMKFTGGKLIVKQLGTDQDCGFGMGVSADGTYTKK
ncbi:MAG: hypothetical protein K1X72_08045 [Pyrinomonadaceae bacterium]|nr:hypothetical protein [Pyrinomonadaceae bacterium]